MTLKRDKQRTLTGAEKFHSNGTIFFMVSESKAINDPCSFVKILDLSYTTGANYVTTFDRSCVCKP
jgi:hypothetical protein